MTSEKMCLNALFVSLTPSAEKKLIFRRVIYWSRVIRVMSYVKNVYLIDAFCCCLADLEEGGRGGKRRGGDHYLIGIQSLCISQCNV